MNIITALVKFLSSFLGQKGHLKTDPVLPVEKPPAIRLAWGKKVSPEFRKRVLEICQELGVNPDYLMACMAFESAETFSPSIKNAAGSGATGLIQFMPATAKGLGTTTGALANMTALQQLEYVHAYFWPYRGRLKTLGDVYMAILWPAGIGKPDTWPLWDKSKKPTTYRQNAGLDINKDGAITKAEATAKVQAKLEKGLMLDYVWKGEL